MKKLNILITGGAGFIGIHLRRVLEKEGHNVSTLDIAKEKSENILEYHDFDADVIYHLAAITNVNESFKKLDEVFVTNVLGTAKVAYICWKNKIKLIYPSTAAIYHKDLSPYAYSKYLAEEIVKGIMKTTPVVVLRLYNVFGEGMNPNTGSIMYNFLHDDKFVVYGDGEQTRDYIHIRDVISIFKDVLKEKWNGKIVDVGTGETYTTNYVAGLFARFRGLPIEYKPPRREIRWSIANRQMLDTLYKKKLTTILERDIAELVYKEYGVISDQTDRSVVYRTGYETN